MPNQIHSDQKRFKQILFNLLGNASKFTFKGQLTVRVSFNEGVLTTDVEDTGIGMEGEDL